MTYNASSFLNSATTYLRRPTFRKTEDFPQSDATPPSQHTPTFATPPHLNASRAPRSPASPQTIRCSDCNRLVPVVELGEHQCAGSSNKSSASSNASFKELQKQQHKASASMSAKKPAHPMRIHVDLARSFEYDDEYAGLATPHASSAGYTESPTYSSPSLSPHYRKRMEESPASPAGPTPALSRSSSSHSQSSSVESSATSRKLPFFEKYDQAFGEKGPLTSPPLGSASQARFNISKSASSSPNTNSNDPTPAMSEITSFTAAYAEEDDTITPSKAFKPFSIPLQSTRSGSLSKNRLSMRLSQSEPDGLAKLAETLRETDNAHERSKSSSLSRPKVEPLNIQKSPAQSAPITLASKQRVSPSTNAKKSPPRSNSKGLDDCLEDLMRAMDDIPDESPTPSNARSRSPNQLSKSVGATSSASPSARPALRPLLLPVNRDVSTPKLASSPILSPPRPRTSPASKKTCGTCRKDVTRLRCHERSGKIFCEACYSDKYQPKCKKCSLTIEGKAIGSGDGKVEGKFHPGCFCCFKCSAPFPSGDFYVFDAKPYCARDYHTLNGSLCITCGEGIEGPCVSLAGEDNGNGGKYHPDHFGCAQPGCKASLRDYHFVLAGLPYCEHHATRLEESTNYQQSISTQHHRRSDSWDTQRGGIISEYGRDELSVNSNSSKGMGIGQLSRGRSRISKAEKRRTIVRQV